MSFNQYASNVVSQGWDEGYVVGNKNVCLRCAKLYSRAPKKYRGTASCKKHETVELDAAWCKGCQSWRCEWCGRNLRTKLADEVPAALSNPKSKNKRP